MSKRVWLISLHMASAGDGEDPASPGGGADVESYPLHVDYCGGECPLCVFRVLITIRELIRAN